jgi:hypothetical protein
MEPMTVLLIAIVIVLALGSLATLFGADTRDGMTDDHQSTDFLALGAEHR